MSGARYTVENLKGCLVEARVERLTTAAEADAYAADVADAAQRCGPPQTAVLCADHRSANIYPPEVADRLLLAFRPNNTRFERIAILVAKDNATLLMQLQRLTREAGSDRRRVFLEPGGALEHLAKSLDAGELERARQFLGG